MKDKPKKELRDPIHGFIPVYEHELKIIQDPVFQRLRRIKQLSFGYLVYHGAEHSRFGHALGAMHLVDIALKKIIDNAEKLKKKVDITDDDIRLARSAALLHDVGHHPFSHALDKTEMIPEKHEEYSKSLIENHFAPVLDTVKINPKDVTNLVLGESLLEKPFLHTLISSQLDMDRFDYLLRDSYYAGVKYGIYDIARLIDSLYVKSDGNLVVLNKGFYAAEQFVLARYHMFYQIYLHHTKRCFEGIAKHAVRHLFLLGEFDYPSPSDLSNKDEIKNFISLDDAWLLKKIRGIQESCMKYLSQCVEIREPYTVLLDSERASLKMMKNKEGEDGSSYLKGIEEELQYELSNYNLREIGINNEDVIFDKAINLPYKLRPYSNPIPHSEKVEDPGTIIIYDDDVDSEEAIEDRSKIVRMIAEKISLRTTYVRKSKKEALWKYLISKHPDLK